MMRAVTLVMFVALVLCAVSCDDDAGERRSDATDMLAMGDGDANSAGDADSGTTDDVADAASDGEETFNPRPCTSAEPDACEVCAIEHCLDLIEPCCGFDGCWTLTDCMLEQRCFGSSCLDLCESEVRAAGGRASPALYASLNLLSCVETECPDACAP